MNGLAGKWVRGLAGALTLLAGVCLLTGCQSLQAMFQPVPPPFPKAVADEPKVRPGISLRVTVLAAGKAEEYKVTVSQAGEIALPLINAVKCDGITVQELQERIQKVYVQYFQSPQVSVQFLLGEGMLSPWGTVLVQGKVLREGPVNIPSTCDLTVTRALQLAGGITRLGDQNKVRITRKLPNGTSCSVEIDIEAISKYGRRENDHVLQANDMIWVPELVW